MPSNIETFSNARDSLPNVYTNIAAREVDFVTRFNKNWDALRTIMGIMRPIRKAPGTKLVSYRASVALESGNVDPGCVIPYSKATIEKVRIYGSILNPFTIINHNNGTGIDPEIST